MKNVVNLDNSTSPFLQNSKKDSFKNIEFGLAGIILGIIVVVIALFALNYFKIINMPQVLKYTSKENLKSKQVETESSFSLKNKETILAKAQKAGYEIYSEITHPPFFNVTSGRNILASKERVVNGYVDEFGWQNKDELSPSRETGIFKSLEKVPGSDDFYLSIISPTNADKIFKMRIINSIPTKYKGANNKTVLNVDDLNYGPLNKSIEPIQKINYFSDIKKSDLDKLMRPGDIIVIYFQFTKNDNNIVVAEDENKAIVADSIEIRRFGGLQAIKEELK